MISAKEDALALLRVMNDKAEGRTDVVVGPDAETVTHAGLESIHRDDAMLWLLAQEALQPAQELNAKAGTLVGQPDYGMSHYITERGLAMLQTGQQEDRSPARR
jgi:hypothetical protein